MMGKTIALIGGPETGKTNFLARLWTSLSKGEGSLSAPTIPDDIIYVEEAVNYLLEARFAPRTQAKGISGMLEIPIEGASGTDLASSTLKVPDVMGEVWDDLVHDRTAKPEIYHVLNEADGALLFVRVLSELNESPLDWVNAQRLLALPLEHKQPTGKLPTQVVLSELLSILEFTSDPVQKRPKVAVIVTGWDLLDAEKKTDGPMAFLESQFPMFAGKILNKSSLEINVYGVSIVGGDLNKDEEFKDKFLETELSKTGYIVQDISGSVVKSDDITEPVRWLLES